MVCRETREETNSAIVINKRANGDYMNRLEINVMLFEMSRLTNLYIFNFCLFIYCPI